MKVLATEIKIGQEIKYGNVWGKVIEEPKQSPYSKSEVVVIVETVAGKIRRRAGNVSRVDGGFKREFCYRKKTNVQTR